MTQTGRVRQIEFKKVAIARKNADAPSDLLGQLTRHAVMAPGRPRLTPPGAM
jgi:hypothetical protein